jgi:hypothetical protein
MNQSSGGVQAELGGDKRLYTMKSNVEKQRRAMPDQLIFFQQRIHSWLE